MVGANNSVKVQLVTKHTNLAIMLTMHCLQCSITKEWNYWWNSFDPCLLISDMTVLRMKFKFVKMILRSAPRFTVWRMRCETSPTVWAAASLQSRSKRRLNSVELGWTTWRQTTFRTTDKSQSKNRGRRQICSQGIDTRYDLPFQYLSFVHYLIGCYYTKSISVTMNIYVLLLLVKFNTYCNTYI